ncbi:HAD-like domain-containing protein [Lipomyces kononenkoae]|uniref:HAD-like domain-containing protein n=1 Tax=Lipomyces kononenkoae TaxID=34357 RepID=A0ACC3T8Z9_LIPKO
MASQYMLLMDWDETITSADTVHLVAEAGYQAHGTSSSLSSGVPPWSEFTNAYMSDYVAYQASFGPRTTLRDELEFLTRSADVEQASVSRIEKAGLFKSVTAKHLQMQAAKVEIRPGFFNVIRRCRTLGVMLGIMSVNWSQVFIRAALEQNFGPCDDVPVYCNEIEFDKDGTGTGVMSNGDYVLRTGADKAKLVRHLMARNSGKKVVYAGDSTGDLHPLLDADVGVVIGEKKSLRETCERVGITVRDISLLDVTSPKDGRVLYCIQEWNQLLLHGPFANKKFVL